MKYSLTMLEHHFDQLHRAFVNAANHERAAVLFCSRSVTEYEVRCLVNRVGIVPSQLIVDSSEEHISLASQAYVSAFSEADRTKSSVIFVHSHPEGHNRFSEMDDDAELELFRISSLRAPNGPHGSMIFVGGNAPALIGRMWVEEGSVPLSRIRVLGKRLLCFDHNPTGAPQVPPWADRQILAFGKEVQQLISSLHVGIVGAGGTGSAVCEQLARLGVGVLTVIDEDRFEQSNVNRVYGSTLRDAGEAKVSLAHRNADFIGTGTEIRPIFGSVYDKHTITLLKECDIVFCCTDDHFGRALLNRLAVWYYIPVIDVAVAIDSEDHVIREIVGRVTLLLPGNACLNCRGRISFERVHEDQLKRAQPDEYSTRVKEGYIRELAQPDPSVIMFTNGIASRALIEFMHIMTGFMGNDRQSSEVIERFHDTDVRTNSRPGQEGCYCSTPNKWGRGDLGMFLGVSW